MPCNAFGQNMYTCSDFWYSMIFNRHRKHGRKRHIVCNLSHIVVFLKAGHQLAGEELTEGVGS